MDIIGRGWGYIRGIGKLPPSRSIGLWVVQEKKFWGFVNSHQREPTQIFSEKEK